ncbi:ANTAR domain-containing protein [Streptomyces sp. NPDC048179]|uniref:ANTAR domain-containing protein n=1 Tax=Streptomyces sp. NPDC048179 TaxID=3365506 RepID=UPI00371BC761
MLEPSDEVPYVSGGGSARPLRSTTTTLLTEVGPAGDRVTVVVSGDYRLDDSRRLQHALHDALARSTQRVDLDLGGLAFADGSALNALLAMRARAIAAGKTITVTIVSPAVERLLTFTDTYALFSAVAGGPQGLPTAEPQGEGTDDGLLQAEVVQLRRAMRTRPDVDLARGILMATFGLSADAAWEVLVTVSQNTNTKLHRLATDLVATVQGEPLPDPVRRHLTTAVATVRGMDAQPQRGARAEATREAVCQEREYA